MEFNTTMVTDIIKKILLALGIAIATLWVSYQIGVRSGQNSLISSPKSEVDTLFIFDTIVQYEPILEERVVLQRVPFPVVDTMVIHDTLYVYLEREQVVWQDSLSRVYASGIFPQIDSVMHFISERVVTREVTIPVKKPCRWGVGVHAGYGVQIGEQVRTTPYIGIGISYNLLSW